MSLNISNDLMRLTDGAKVAINLSKFGPRQLVTFRRFVRTGVIRGGTATAGIARELRIINNLPYIHWARRRTFSWRGIDISNFDSLTAALVAKKLLEAAAAPAYHSRYQEQQESALTACAPSGVFHGCDKTFWKVASQINLPKYVEEVPMQFDLQVTKTLTW